MAENWKWADELIEGSDFAETFEVEDSNYDPDTDTHFYFNPSNMCLAVTPDGDVVIFEEDDPEACPGCGCKPGDGITPGCDHPMGCGFFKE